MQARGPSNGSTTCTPRPDRRSTFRRPQPARPDATIPPLRRGVRRPAAGDGPTADQTRREQQQRRDDAAGHRTIDRDVRNNAGKRKACRSAALDRRLLAARSPAARYPRLVRRCSTPKNRVCRLRLRVTEKPLRATARRDHNSPRPSAIPSCPTCSRRRVLVAPWVSMCSPLVKTTRSPGSSRPAWTSLRMLPRAAWRGVSPRLS